MEATASHAYARLEDPAALLRRQLGAGDLVFIKGRGTDHLTRILFAKFGEIGCWVGRCPIRRPCDLCERLQPGFDLASTIAASTATFRLPVTELA